ncbi:aminoacyl-tRNA hydrolase [Candidatus Methylacidiphilum infernorum]|uniref:Peptidyl-tRNA hydrolase n=1 Tax=Candidatus Methylacidiphilum infernorum TaxID=511746 RepID=A0ABX7PUI0_9BACT|nr:aminoacyl-tRNA hydrolase [Candidatus Methylacidiphilum infernorum]QSR86562.1 aminoacyl-tRNA hydrolase [Candidatus Methylacidiphilum infernorum]
MGVFHIVVGLGNPGQEYEKTRHNIGWRVVEELVKRQNLSFKIDKKAKSKVACKEKLVFVLPLTYMNLSGQALSYLLQKEKCSSKDILVILDDISLPLGKLRFRPKGSSGGHKGLESIIEELHTEDIPRLRLGIGPLPEGEQLADYVLKPFLEEEKVKVEEMIFKAIQFFECLQKEGIEIALNKLNA